MSATLALTQDLMARNSVTPADAGCQEVMGKRLEALGFTVETLRYGNVENFWAVRRGEGPLLCFAGHTDVVPTGPLEEWRSNPFVPTIRDGVLYGRISRRHSLFSCSRRLIAAPPVARRVRCRPHT
ncbi:MAG: M20/M25/M40 family metallo-hydrolase, partial [Gammaproteobacteria bacterium]|nr:M20/M25/M40 family metallo-hydrolase [Gammaproteobacteria bacterium]